MELKDFQQLMNQLLTIKTKAENELLIDPKQVGKIKIVQQGLMNTLFVPRIEFELVVDTDRNVYILFKQER